MKKIYYIGIILLLWNGVLKAQSLSNLRVCHYAYADTVCFDSVSVVPGSLLVYGEDKVLLNPNSYTVSYDNACLVFNNPLADAVELKLVYRVFPISFAVIDKGDDVFVFEPTTSVFATQKQTLENSSLSNEYEEQRIQASGNISRGLSAGNGQNVVLNSNLNLQLTGKVDNNISIEAVLSDENVPVQPNGYTQQVNAFDQIYIRLYDSLRYLQMGDVDVRNQKGHFLKYQRRLQGADFGGTFFAKNNVSYKTKASAAIAKGTFNRVEFNGIEGVQGPYPLMGVNQEQFIVVLAGSERVFIDGVRLMRGENADYIINYNTAELTFMNKNMINKNTRVIVEFEYSDRNYNRFLVSGYTERKTAKNSIAIQLFSESDAKNQPVNQDLNDSEKYVLSQAGNNPLKAIVPDFDSVVYDINRVLYAMLDTVVGGVAYDSVFKVSFSPDSAFYQVGFALVGQGNGNYVLLPSSANGKVYTWIAPLLGVPQGNYAPIDLIVAPKSHQMVVVSLKQKIGNHSNANMELAFSNKNLNTYSVIDNEHNEGIALNSGFDHVFDLSSLKLKSYGDYEYVHKDFIAVERFRSAEFNRDWNINALQLADQHLAIMGFGLMKKERVLIDLSASYLNQIDFIEGLRLDFAADLENERNGFSAKQSMLWSDDLIKTTQFYRHDLRYDRNFTFLKAGVGHAMESNKQRALVSDSLLLNSQQFSEFDAFVQMHDTLHRTIGVNYIQRVDYLPFQDKMEASTSSNDFVLNAKFSKAKNNDLKLSATYRKLRVLNEEILRQVEGEDNFLAKMNHQLRLAKNTFNFSTFYEVGSGLEAKQEFVYVEVAVGQGVYVWIDYNGNGIPELDEFEVAKFIEEANYIRIYTPSNDYTKAYTLKMNHTFKLNPSRIWRRSTGLKKFGSRFSNVASLRLMRKQTSDEVSARLNPFDQRIVDTALLNNRSSVRNTFSFNRSNPKFTADWVFIYSSSRNLMVNGFDASNQKSNQFQFRWNITSVLFLRNSINFSEKRYASEFFTTRDYDISGISNKVNLQWQPNSKFRATFFYDISDKKNLMGEEVSFVQEFGPEIKINSPGKGSITSRVSMVYADYNGSENSSVSYEMLGGFVPGENFKWTVNAAYNINKYLRMSIGYNGRKGGDVPVIHTGQASVSAFF